MKTKSYIDKELKLEYDANSNSDSDSNSDANNEEYIQKKVNLIK